MSKLQRLEGCQTTRSSKPYENVYSYHNGEGFYYFLLLFIYYYIRNVGIFRKGLLSKSRWRPYQVPSCTKQHLLVCKLLH